MDAGSFVVLAGIIGIIFAFYQFMLISKIKVEPGAAGTSLQTFKRSVLLPLFSQCVQQKIILHFLKRMLSLFWLILNRMLGPFF